jgi:ubiquinol oxidase
MEKLGSADEEDGSCKTFVSPEGEVMEVMCADYGFRSGNMRLYQDEYGSVPTNAFSLGFENFKKEFEQLRRAFRFDEFETVTNASPPTNPVTKAIGKAGSNFVQFFASIDRRLEDAGAFPKLGKANLNRDVLNKDGSVASEITDVRDLLNKLELSNEAVLIREHKREAAYGKVEAPWFIRLPFSALCWTLDVVFANRPIQRFWVLETVARVPYFAFISVLHLYETLGWWRAGAGLRKVHFAEEWNEMHHLQIMESLGGDSLWLDRFMAQHGAIVYYWVLIAFFFLFPSLAYKFGELVEVHAADTYAEFVEANADLLKQLPPPAVALEYYKGDDLYLFDDFQTSEQPEPRRPNCNNLYDVFVNIRDDELEHVKTMVACEDNSISVDIREKARSAKKKVNKPELSGNVA